MRNPSDIASDRTPSLNRRGPAGSSSASPSAADDGVAIARQIIAELFGPPQGRAFSVEFWNGIVDRPARQTPRFTFVLRSAEGLRRMLLPPSELAFAEAYIRGDIDVAGDLEAAATVSLHAVAERWSPGRFARLIRLARRLPARRSSEPHRRRPALRLLGPTHSLERDTAAVRFHYDIGNDFYRLWLDRRLVYSCAYFEHDADDLDTAQTAKLEHICRKLRLRPGERLLDIGCGWGGLIIYAAEHYGVEAVGITISEEQASLARERIRAAGLTQRCRVELRDYREIPTTQPFDKIASVGMVEHVGLRRLPTYFAHAYAALRPGGLFLNAGIVASPAHLVAPSWLTRRLWHEGQFIQRYVFPDGELVPLARMVDLAEQAGFETHDVEGLRQHYVFTLRRWRERLEAAYEDAVKLVGEPTYRVWRLYLAGSAHSFATGRNNVVHMLLSRPGPGGRIAVPLTRRDLYVDAGSLAEAPE